MAFLFSATPPKETPKGKIKKLIAFVLSQTQIIMQQVYHSNAKTNLNIRFQLQNNSGSNSELASRFNVSKLTVSKWKNRDFSQDSSCKLMNIKHPLSDLEKALALILRIFSWVSIGEVWENLLEINPK